jgi:hypothetical protein
MALQRSGFLWDRTHAEQQNAPSSGDGSPGIGSYGERLPNYKPQVVSERMSTAGGIGSVAAAPVDCRFTTLQAEAQAAAEQARRSAGL